MKIDTRDLANFLRQKVVESHRNSLNVPTPTNEISPTVTSEPANLVRRSAQILQDHQTSQEDISPKSKTEERDASSSCVTILRPRIFHAKAVLELKSSTESSSQQDRQNTYEQSTDRTPRNRTHTDPSDTHTREQAYRSVSY